MVDRAWTIKEAIKAVTEANSIVRIRPGETPGDVRERVEFEAVELLRSLVALGLLKLGESRAKPDFSADLTVELQASGCKVSIRDIEAALKAAGLRIVDDGERG